MTALTQYARLEAPGLWRPAPDAQRQNVVLSLGEATLTISDNHDNVLTHWSLAAVNRLNPGTRPALFSPGDDADEELELDDDMMIDAVEKVRRTIEKRRPHPGKLRLWISGIVLGSVAALTVFWLPDALRSYTVSVVPQPTRVAIGQAILNRIGRVAGKQCTDADGRGALERLGLSLLGEDGPRVIVLSSGVQTATHLPGHITLINRALIEDFEEPDVVAGFLLVEEIQRGKTDPMRPLLEHAGLRATAQLLTTGKLPKEVIDAYAEWLLTTPPAPLSEPELLDRFKQAGLRSSPYAYALDLTGESTVGLIEADPVPLSQASPLLTDADWVRLQGICGE
ncbi:hypothetical protein [Aliiroseovarius marinus]|uniref:hypothetical protein n=1 Tax=Aliiroseovarius marinus TaxID=2500159 RepID=UPI003D7EF6C5